ncbi:MAG: AraC family transcriptional regulator, partial [Clostridia bacterium]
ANGLEAVQECERLQPDLVITDIRMPLVDGLSMCRQVQKLLPAIRFIILSGYDDFEYARQAISIHCLGYLLKPISSAEFRDMLADTKKRLDDEFAQRRDLGLLQAHFRNSLPLLRETLLASLLTGGTTPEEAVETARRYGLALDARQYVTALIRTGEPAAGDDAITDPELLNFAVINIAEESLQAHATAHVFHYHGLVAALILLHSDGQQAFADCVSWLDETGKLIDHYLNCHALIGVSAPVQRLEQLPNAARQALSALDQCTIWDQQQVLCVTDLEPSSMSAYVISDLALRRFSNALKLGQSEAIAQVLGDIMAECRDSKPTPKMYRTCLLELFMTLQRTARDMSLDIGLTDCGGENVLDALMACPPPEQAQNLLVGLCKQFSAAVTERRASSSRLLAQQAADYLNAHYQDEELTIETLCGQLHISPSYFSVLFKKETKKTFVQYLTDLRMNKAMTLLAGTEMKTVQIAQEIGIADPSYFSYSFKKYFGVSPSQARKGNEAAL